MSAPSLLSDAPVHASTYTLTKPVFIVGFMGAGKTTAARRVARVCGLNCIDSDTYISHSNGVRSSFYIKTFGEHAFRDAETRALEELCSLPPAIISCGGGIVEREENRALLSRGYVIYFEVSAEEARSRISNLNTRPLLGTPGEAEALIEHRRPLYEEVSDAIIDTAGCKPGQLCGRVIRLLREAGVLCVQANGSEDSSISAGVVAKGKEPQCPQQK